MSMDKLREEIELAIKRERADLAAAEADLTRAQLRVAERQSRIAAYQDVLGTMDELGENEPIIAPEPIVARPLGTGRAPRRDVQGTIKQAVRDYMEAKGLGPKLEDVVIGAGILLGSDIAESAARRALDGLIAKGEMREHDGRYAPPPLGPTSSIVSEISSRGAGTVTPPQIHLPPEAAK